MRQNSPLIEVSLSVVIHCNFKICTIMVMYVCAWIHGRTLKTCVVDLMVQENLSKFCDCTKC